MATDGYVTLTLEVRKERKLFASRCPELGVASCGDTLDEAVENLRDATFEYLNSIERLGQRKRIFQERNLKITKSRPALVRREYDLPPGSFAGPMVTKIPATSA